ncbi:MAG: ABC transporter ATP-binding protein [Eubacteriales bacterium]
MSYIKFENIVKDYGQNTVLRGINLEVEKGQLVTLLGPSGCGKSTLLRCLAGLEQVTSGKIYLDGGDITEQAPQKRNVGMVFQQYSLFPNMTVEQNIGFGLKMQKVPSDIVADKVREAIKLVELEGKEKSYPANLSGGQQQRVALARSIVMEPKVLLLDEPLSAIDAKLRKSLQSRIREIHEELGLTTIFVTHDQDEAMVMSDVIQLFNQGEIEQSGNPVSMYTAPQSRFAASFIGSYNIINGSEFKKLVHAIVPAGCDVAIRPETISITRERVEENDCYQLKGKIISNVPRGNVLRYQVEVEDVALNVDVLFRSFTLFEAGEEVCVRIPKKDCLTLR